MNFNHFGLMLDCSRNAVMSVSALKKYMDLMQRLGYNCLMLYTEDTYEIEGEPYFGHNRGRYSSEEIKELDAYAKAHEIELMPCIQTLAHLNAIFRWNKYKEFNDCEDILLAEDEKTYELIEKMFATLAKNFTSRTVNIGMDEAHLLGRGKYMDIHGAVDRFEMLIKHLRKVSEIAQKYGFKLLMWGDMFFRIMSGGDYYADDITVDPEILALIPDNVELIYWDYYSTDKNHYKKQIELHKKIKEDIWFAGGLWCWNGFVPQNTFSINATEKALNACNENGVNDVILTLWGDDGHECPKWSVLPSMFYSAELVKGITDENIIKADFEKEFGVSFDDFMLLDLPGTTSCDPENTYTSSKYMFYNDMFMGQFDSLVKPRDSEIYNNLSEKIAKLTENKDFGYMFDCTKCLCDVLALKSDLGLRTREAYVNKDKNKLKMLLSDYDKLSVLVDKFYTAFENQWMTENKPQGFDVQDIRIGGLIQRIKHCRNRLEQYINGRLESLEELEEPVLDPLCRAEDAGKPIIFNNWKQTATNNVI